MSARGKKKKGSYHGGELKTYRCVFLKSAEGKKFSFPLREKRKFLNKKKRCPFREKEEEERTHDARKKKPSPRRTGESPIAVPAGGRRKGEKMERFPGRKEPGDFFLLKGVSTERKKEELDQEKSR